MKFCTVNGNEKSEMSINDRGFSYGDGLFTTAKIIDGKVLMLTEHINRLVFGCAQLGLPKFDSQQLRHDLTLVAKPFCHDVLKVIITAGVGGRGYSRVHSNKAESHLNIIIMVFDFPAHYEQWKKTGITLGVSQQRMGINPMLSQVKHLNRLEQVLFRAELDDVKEDDLVIMNINDHIIETSSANIFWWTNNQLYTPDIINSGVAGLMRQCILDNHKSTTVSTFSLPELEQADEIFICNSIMGIVPVKQYKDKALSINASLALSNALGKVIHV